jgi:hypothetical protein
MFELKQRYTVKSFIGTLAYLLICTFIFSCAQVVAPGGGPKDTKPPKVVKYIPDSAQLYFKVKSIIINFDEFVQLKDLNNQLIISPPLEKTPDITVKNKTLSITFDKKDSLKPNTTYCISFGNAVQDITENNPIENFKYIFSTGNFIDSLTLKGKVQNAFNHSTEKGILVMLYSNFDDSVIYKKLPDYFAKTKEDGTFQINNIKDGKYKLVALKDANSNYKYDGENESIGFVDAPIDPSEKKSILIDLFQEPAKKLYLKKRIHNEYGKIVFIFNKPTDSLHITPINYTFNEKDILLDYSKNKDTLNYWIKNFDKDSLKLQVSNGYKILDTVEFKMIKKEDALKTKKNPLKLKLLNNFNGNQGVDLNGEIKLTFSQPIQTINDKINVSLKKDSTLMKNLIFIKDDFYKGKKIEICLADSTIMVEDPNKKGVFIHAPTLSTNIGLKENTSYHLFIPPGTFTDIFGLTNDTIKMDFKTHEEKYYGSVKLTINTAEIKGQYIIQLLDEKENLVRESYIKKGEAVTYEYLHPQLYKLKIIEDENNNGKWDSGDYLQKQQPEKVIYYNGTINVRSNWDLDLEWKINE